jgi:hypothetical protein
MCRSCSDKVGSGPGFLRVDWATAKARSTGTRCQQGEVAQDPYSSLSLNGGNPGASLADFLGFLAADGLENQFVDNLVWMASPRLVPGSGGMLSQWLTAGASIRVLFGNSSGSTAPGQNRAYFFGLLLRIYAKACDEQRRISTG